MATAIRLPMTRYDFPQLLDALGMKHGVEIGTYQGAYSYYLLKHSSLRVLWSVDAWSGKYTRTKEDAKALLSQFGNRSKILHATSVDGAKLAHDTKAVFDFIYIDANHKSAFVEQDIEAWLPLLKRPGILAGHDYIQAGRMIGVVPVVDALAERLAAPLYLTREEWASWFFILG